MDRSNSFIRGGARFAHWVLGAKNQSNRFQVVEMLPDHTDKQNADYQPVAGQEGYFQIWLRSMFLADGRLFTSDRYAAVQSYVVFPFSAETAEIAVAAGPGQLKNVGAGDLGTVVTLNIPLSPLLPYGGSQVGVAVGLLSMKDEDLAARVLDGLGSLSTLVTAPVFSTAIGAAHTINDAVSAILGVDDDRLVLGFIDTFTDADPGAPRPLKSYHFAVIGDPDNRKFPAEYLWLENNGLMVQYLGSQEQRSQLERVDYFVLYVETKRTRQGSWEQLKYLADPYFQAIKKMPNIMAAHTSPDLIPKDRVAVGQAIRRAYEEVRKSRDGLLESTALPSMPDSLDALMDKYEVSIEKTDDSAAEALLKELLI
jgi:hypothetical protein